jgi:chemotaxis protein methyltransferase CheR
MRRSDKEGAIEERLTPMLESAEFLLTRRDFDKISKIVHAETGIVLPANKVNLVYSRLAKRLRILEIKTFREYCDLIAEHAGKEERLAMIAALTTNVTRFFREPHHFEHLRDKMMPLLIEALRNGERVRLWSAACSSGQEAYSMALTILSVLPDATHYDIKILATDIDPNMIAQGEAGLYDASLMSGVPPAFKQRWFKPREPGSNIYEVSRDVRALVTFRQLNLLESWPMKGRFDAIFCRNVVIYFDSETQERLWTRMSSLLHPQGTLYIGHSERVNGAAERLFVSSGITTYRLAQPAHC